MDDFDDINVLRGRFAATVARQVRTCLGVYFSDEHVRRELYDEADIAAHLEVFSVSHLPYIPLTDLECYTAVTAAWRRREFMSLRDYDYEPGAADRVMSHVPRVWAEQCAEFFGLLVADVSPARIVAWSTECPRVVPYFSSVVMLNEIVLAFAVAHNAAFVEMCQPLCDMSRIVSSTSRESVEMYNPVWAAANVAACMARFCQAQPDVCTRVVVVSRAYEGCVVRALSRRPEGSPAVRHRVFAKSAFGHRMRLCVAVSGRWADLLMSIIVQHALR